MLTVRPSVIEDAHLLAPRLRPEDVAEIRAVSGSTPLDALVRAYQQSLQPFTITDDREPVAMFGVAPCSFCSILGAVWLLGSPAIERNARQFLRESRSWVERLHEYRPVLWNVVDARNVVHIRWLKWIGCTFIGYHESLGPENRPFYEFIHV